MDPRIEELAKLLTQAIARKWVHDRRAGATPTPPKPQHQPSPVAGVTGTAGPRR